MQKALLQKYKINNMLNNYYYDFYNWSCFSHCIRIKFIHIDRWCCIFIISIIVIYYSCKHKAVFNRKIATVILVVTLVGLGLRVLGITQYKGKGTSGLATIHFFLIPIRLVALFCCYAPFFNYPE